MKLKKTSTLTLLALASLVAVLGAAMAAPKKASAANAITYPVIGPSSFVNDYYYRRGSRMHEAIDVMASKGQLLVAVVDGTITRVNYPQPDWGYAIYITDVHGYKYGYLHMNDDNPGTNDGQGGGMHAYGPDMKTGVKVKKGQHIGWVGDSGHSNGVPHLHFEMYEPGGRVVNPYDSLRLAPHLTKPNLYPALAGEVLPYGRSYKGGANIEMGNFDGDPDSEYAVGSGRGMSSSVTIYDHNNNYVRRFSVYAPDFTGGVYVGTADIDNDGTDEIITGAGRGGTPLVKIYEPTGTEVGRFYAYAKNIQNGVIVSGGNVNGIGVDEVVTSLASGGAPRIKTYTAAGVQQTNFYAYGETTKFGTDVTVGDVIAGGGEEIITSPLKGGVPKIKIFDNNGNMARQFYAYAQDFVGGVRVSAGDVKSGTSGIEILTVPASSAAQHIKAWTGAAGYLGGEKFLEEWWIGYYDIAAGADKSKAAAFVNRRVTVRDGLE